MPTLIVGNYGAGTFSQSGGVNAVASNLYLGNDGGSAAYNLSGGSLAAPWEYVGYFATGSVITQSGGTNSVTSGLYLGYAAAFSGAYNLSGSGLLSATSTAAEYIGYSGSGSFTQSGGTNSIAGGNLLYLGYNLHGSGTYSLSGTGLLVAGNEDIAVSGTGTFTQTGGTNSTGQVYVGALAGSCGAYNLAGGSLSANYEYAGNLAASAAFVQTGGTNTVGSELYIGANGGGAYYSLGGSGSLIAAHEVVGLSGSGDFTQTGGTNDAANLVLAQAASSYGVYNLNGGRLLLSGAGLTQGAGSAAFNFGGGTLAASAPFTATLNMSLTGSGGNATIDTTGGNINLPGVLSGSGGLNKAGTGTLSLGGQNTFSGSTLILAGTSLLENSNAMENSTVSVLVDNGLEFLPGIATFHLGGLAGGNLLTLSNTNGSAITLSVGGNGASTTFSGNIGGNGTMVKVGTGMLTFSGSNSYSGGGVISAGLLAFGATSAVPSTGTITIAPSGALAATPIFDAAEPVSGWLAGGRIAPSPSGAIALPNGTSDNESIALSATSNGLSLGAIGSATYGGTLTTVGSTMYLGGGGGNLYFTSYLTGSESLAVGTRGVPGGSVVLTGVNALGGTLRVDGGTLQLPGGSLTMTSSTTGYEYVGYTGTGTVTQTGGTNTIGTALVLGESAASLGNYNLVGGLLVVPSVVQGSGSGSLNITGGSLTATTGALTVATPIVLSAAGSNGTFNTSGSSITLAGQISGAGGLTKTGPSTLVLAADNTFTGTTAITQGVLLLTNSNAAQGTTVNVTVNNGLQFGTGIGTFNIGALGGAGQLVLADTGGSSITAVTGGNNANTTYSGAISGIGTLVHGGSGVLYLTGSNSYTGGTILTADAAPGGIVVTSQSSFVGPYTFAGDNSLGFAAGFSATNAITFDSGVNGAIDTLGNMVAFTGVMSGGGTLNKIDSGTLVLFSSNSLSGAAAISQGSLQLANANAAANSTVTVNSDNGLQFSHGIGTFNVGGLSGGNALTLADTNGAPVNLEVGGNNQNTTFSGAISGAGTLTKVGDGSLDLNGTSSWTGGLGIDPGTIVLGSDAALGAPNNPLTFLGSGTLQAGGPVTLSSSRAITIKSGATAAFDPAGNTLVVGGPITGAGTLAVTGSGTLVLANSNNAYSGGTIVSGGALEASMTSSLPGAFTPGKVSIAAGAMLVAAVGDPQQWTAANVDSLLAVLSSSAGFGIDASGGSFNPNSINYTGRVLALTGSDSYTGVTTVSQGTLDLANSAALVASTVAVSLDKGLQFSPRIGTFYLGGLSGGKRLDLDDTGGDGVALIVGGDGQSTTYSGRLTGNGSLTWAGSGRLTLSGTSNTYSGGTYVVQGTLIATNSEALADDSDLTIGDGDMFAAIDGAPLRPAGLNEVAPVPEPSALAFFAAASLLAAGAAIRLRRTPGGRV